jgi:hypothetical protein
MNRKAIRTKYLLPLDHIFRGMYFRLAFFLHQKLRNTIPEKLRGDHNG